MVHAQVRTKSATSVVCRSRVRPAPLSRCDFFRVGFCELPAPHLLHLRALRSMSGAAAMRKKRLGCYELALLKFCLAVLIFMCLGPRAAHRTQRIELARLGPQARRRSRADVPHRPRRRGARLRALAGAAWDRALAPATARACRQNCWRTLRLACACPLGGVLAHRAHRGQRPALARRQRPQRRPRQRPQRRPRKPQSPNLTVPKPRPENPHLMVPEMRPALARQQRPLRHQLRRKHS